jgi:galactonate dehydratase
VFSFEDGYVDLPDGAGLGVEIDESVVRDRAGSAEDWHNPVWRHDDGSVAEW